MSTRSIKQKVMSEETGASSIFLLGIQDLFVKELQKIEEMKLYKQEIITGVESVEAKINKKMTALEEQI